MKEIQLEDLILLAKQTGVIQRQAVFGKHMVTSKGHADDPVTETENPGSIRGTMTMCGISIRWTER